MTWPEPLGCRHGPTDAGSESRRAPNPTRVGQKSYRFFFRLFLLWLDEHVRLRIDRQSNAITVSASLKPNMHLGPRFGVHDNQTIAPPSALRWKATVQRPSASHALPSKATTPLTNDIVRKNLTRGEAIANKLRGGPTPGA
jgi:hypothetical protein